LQALAGATLGPLGERLDETLRGIALEHLAVRALGPGEAIVHEGQPVPGVAVVGVGTVVLESAGTRRGEVGAGGIVLADEVLGGAPASASAKAGPDGAVVLFGERKQVHELLVSCPPLLEIFAGM
jgi:CRP-like cAMP-binding protein